MGGILTESKLRRCHRITINKLLKETRFTQFEIENLLVIYHKIQMTTSDKEMPIHHSHLKRFLINGLSLSDLKMHPYILAVVNCNYGKYITHYTFVKLMSLYLHGTLLEKIDYCFAVGK